jgi:predicted RNA polymerase sigma factor
MTLAEDQTAEAFARARSCWHRVSRHPAPRALAVRTALNAGVSWWHGRSKETALTSHDTTAADSQRTGLEAAALTALRRLPVRQPEVMARLHMLLTIF